MKMPALLALATFGEATKIEIILIAKASEQGDQIGQFFANWANFRGEI